MIYLSTFLLALFLSMALVPLMARAAGVLQLVDLPGARKIHEQPIPRTGGLAMALAALVPVLLWCPLDGLCGPLLAGAGIIVLFGVIDDRVNLGYQVKFAGQIAAALVVVLVAGVEIRSLGTLLPEGVLLPRWLAVPLTVFVVVGVTNAINLSDGLDGLAGGMSAMIFCSIAGIAYFEGEVGIALVAAAVAGAAFGFLRFNSFPATVFMGDAGSQFLGFGAIVLSLALTQRVEPLSKMLPLVLLGLPILDTLAVMSERLAEGRSPFSPDRNHLHHKLIRLGLYQPDAVRLIYGVQTCLVAAAFALRFWSGGVILGVYVAFAGAVVCAFLLAERRGWRFGQYGRWKEALRELRARGVAVRVCFRVLLVAVPCLLFVSVLAPGLVPRPYAVFAGCGAGLLCGAWAFGRHPPAAALRVTVYLAVPVALFMANAEASRWLHGALARVYNLSFGGVVLLSFLVIKFSRRRAFQSTPFDVLILAIALLLPTFGGEIRHVGFLAARIIALFFGYEVLLTELRGEVGWVSVATLATLGVLGIRGMM